MMHPVTGTGRGQLPAGWVLAIVCLGVFITALDQTVVVTALPSVMADLKLEVTTDADRAAWIITGYLIGYTVAMPLLGRVSDIYGYARLYRASLVVFALGSALVALAPHLEFMVAARVVQAIGGGATVPMSMALASNALPPRRRGLAIGLVVAAAEGGSMLGPAYGGAIIELLDWRWIFWLNIPQSAVLLLALRRIPANRLYGPRVDYLAGGLLAATLVVLTLALSREGLFTLSSVTPFIILAPGLVLTAVLVAWERRALHPLLSPIFFRSRAFVMANLAQLLEGVAIIIAMVTIPLMANTVMQRDPLTGGWWLLRMTVAIPVGAVLGGILMPLLGARTVAIAGLGLAGLGMFLASTWELDIAEPWLTLHLAIAGLGFGLNNTPLMTRALSAVGEDYRATVASFMTVARMIGMALGLAALSAWGVERFQLLTAGLDFPANQEQWRTYIDALNAAGLTLFHNFFRIAGAMALLAIIPALAMRADPREQQEQAQLGSHLPAH